MRPLRLEVEGLTSFRDRVALDFAGLDLFAITGPTGAGKSSLIDAMVLALFGQVPRVSDKYKQLISHGAERLSVRFDFSVGGETYRVARTIRATGSPQLRLERLNGKGAEPIADRDKEIREEVERILGLDYDAFIRSVVLPQGQFDAFLKGKPEERRKILVALLNLKVYEDMHGLVNRRATEARREAEFLGRQLASDFAEATPERLRALRQELAAAEKARKAREKALAAVAEGLACAGRVREARRDVQAIEGEAAEESVRGERARLALARAAARKEEIEARARELEARAGAAAGDEARLLVLAAVQPRAQQLVALEGGIDRLEKERAAASGQLQDARAEVARQEAALPLLDGAARGAREALDAARRGREELHQRHAAHALRRVLAPGQPCPVCAQPVRVAPKGEKAPAALKGADDALRTAEAAVTRADAAAQEARVVLERGRAQVAGAERHLAELAGRRDEMRSEARSLRAALAEAALDGDAPAHRLAEAVAAELSGLQKAKAARESLEAARRALEADRAAGEAALASARAQAESALARLAALRERQAGAAAALEEARRALLARGGREGWKELEHPLFGQDEADVLEGRRASLQRDGETEAGRVARLRGDAERLEKDIARGAELAEGKRTLEGQAALASCLAQHLQANQFIAYVQEEAMRVLAADASHHLKELSQGRYSLACDEQDFQVIDHWNADRVRSVKTLSGGETFLASLALALALAERLAELAAEGGAGDRLESLFLDEGFGTLDPETLELVLRAIETLHGGTRLVGVVTHIAELAERLPARVVVSGGQGAPAAVTVS